MCVIVVFININIITNIVSKINSETNHHGGQTH